MCHVSRKPALHAWHALHAWRALQAYLDVLAGTGFNGKIVTGVEIPPECCGHTLTMDEVNSIGDWQNVRRHRHPFAAVHTAAGQSCKRVGRLLHLSSETLALVLW